MNISTYNIGLQGLQSATSGMNKAAGAIVESAYPKSDSGVSNSDQYTAAVVELKQQELMFQASGKIISAADSITGSIIDLLA